MMGLTPEPPPPFWHYLCTDWLALAPQESLRWWDAVCHASSPHAVALWGAMRYSTALGERPTAVAELETLVQTTLTPRLLVDTLDALVGEGHLTLAQANPLIEAVLRQTTRTGA
jgi:hypothetical protein